MSIKKITSKPKKKHKKIKRLDSPAQKKEEKRRRRRRGRGRQRPGEKKREG